MSSENADLPPTRQMGRLAAAAVFTTTLEWFDFLIYATAAALVLSDQFFPSVNPVAGTLAAFATFAVEFLARPLGGIVAGHIGNRFGRKPPLVAAMLVMGLATFGIGVLPPYASIGGCGLRSSWSSLGSCRASASVHSGVALRCCSPSTRPSSAAAATAA